MRFQKGNKYGKGRPKMSEVEKNATQLSKTAIKNALNKVMHLDRDQLQKFANDPKNTAHEIIIASILIQALKKGDHQRLDWLYSRLVGKVKDEIDHTVKSSYHEEMVNYLALRHERKVEEIE